MKIADLLDEHGLKLFRYSNILFGILRGIFGSLLIIYGDIYISIMILAINLTFIVRNKLDYLNHQIAGTMIIISFLIFKTFVPLFGIIAYIGILAIGILRDYIGDKMKTKNKILQFIDNWLVLYYILALVLSIYFGTIEGFLIVGVSYLAYSLTKYIGQKYGYK